MLRKLLLEALFSMGGRGDINSLYEYMKERVPSLTMGELENLVNEVLADEEVVRKGDELLVND